MTDNSFAALDKLSSFYINENEEKDCILLINGKRLRQKNNVVVFESPAQALATLKRLMGRHYMWVNYTNEKFMQIFTAWVDARVVLVSPEEYYRGKRKMREIE